MEKAKCIVLRKIRYSDADLILHTIDQNGCKLNFLARSALKSKKRFGGGVLEPTHYIQASFSSTANAATGGLHTLKEASLINDFPAIKKDYDRLNAAFQLLALTDQLSHEHDLDSENVFHLLGNSLKALEQRSSLVGFHLQFELKLLNYLGVLPQMEGAAEYLRQPMSFEWKDDTSWDLESRVKTVIERYRKGLSG